MKKTRRKKKSGLKIAIISFIVVCVVCIIGAMIIEQNEKTITSDQALKIVLKDLGVTEDQVGSPHIHEGTYKDQPCYNIYVTVNGESLTYVVSKTGKILYKGEGSHSH